MDDASYKAEAHGAVVRRPPSQPSPQGKGFFSPSTRSTTLSLLYSFSSLTLLRSALGRFYNRSFFLCNLVLHILSRVAFCFLYHLFQGFSQQFVVFAFSQYFSVLLYLSCVFFLYFLPCTCLRIHFRLAIVFP